GIKYSVKQKTVRDVMIFAAGTAIFGWSYTTLLPVIANNDATTLGYFFSASGTGALIGAVIVSIYAKKLSPMKFILGGAALFVSALTVFAFVRNFYIDLGLLTITGFGLLLQFSTMMTLMQFM